MLLPTTPPGWIIQALRRSLDFQGRAARAEYWWMIALTMALAGIGMVVDAWLFGNDPLIDPLDGVGLWTALILTGLPQLAVSIRRLHDQNLSGWWFLVTLLPYAGVAVQFWWMSRIGTQGANRFGPDPLPEPDNPTRYF
ncbi:MAG: DUF805 domain-containing protein [Alphaproteobacteria bacterium]|nr:DUF805 domain-containing protein [Alphaproteobacteria bacterium]